jgi:hypothetical protein
MKPRLTRGLRAIEMAVLLLAATVTAAILWASADHPPQQDSVETLEALASAQVQPNPSSRRASPGDLAMARSFCAGSLTRQLSRLEREAPERARDYRLSGGHVRFGPAQLWNGLPAAEATLTLEGRQQDLARALATASTWAPGLLFDVVSLTPTNGSARLEARGKVVCLAP